MNLTAAFFVAGVWMIAAAIWQQSYRATRVDPGSKVVLYLGADVVPAAILALIVGYLA